MITYIIHTLPHLILIILSAFQIYEYYTSYIVENYLYEIKGTKSTPQETSVDTFHHQVQL